MAEKSKLKPGQSPLMLRNGDVYGATLKQREGISQGVAHILEKGRIYKWNLQGMLEAAYLQGVSDANAKNKEILEKAKKELG